MAVFMLETESVESAASSLESLTSELTSLSSTVSGYDTSGEYASEFDFDGPKGVIASNIEACSTKVSNTAVYMHDVVGAHTALQNSLAFDQAKEESKTGDQKPTSSTGTTSSGTPRSSSSGGYTSGGYPSGGGHSSSGGRHSSTGGSQSTTGGGKETKTTPETEPKTEASTSP